MLLRPDILASALDKNIKKGEKIIYLSPRGKKFDQNVARSLSKEKNLNLICGHFEGVDQRLIETRNIEEYSLGDFVLSGGEPASFVFVDALVRLFPGVLGNKDSVKEESFFTPDAPGRRLKFELIFTKMSFKPFSPLKKWLKLYLGFIPRAIWALARPKSASNNNTFLLDFDIS